MIFIVEQIQHILRHNGSKKTISFYLSGFPLVGETCDDYGKRMDKIGNIISVHIPRFKISNLVIL